jgi:hypothetical protein
MSTNYDLICVQHCTVVRVVQTKLIYFKQKLETLVKNDIYSYKGGSQTFLCGAGALLRFHGALMCNTQLSP